MTATPGPRDASTGKGVGIGLLLGVALWVAYFVQARTWDRFSWQVTVLPVLVLIGGGALVIGTTHPAARRVAVGVSVGVGLSLLLALVGFVAIFAALDLE